jgi:hypothetical protein
LQVSAKAYRRGDAEVSGSIPEALPMHIPKRLLTPLNDVQQPILQKVLPRKFLARKF